MPADPSVYSILRQPPPVDMGPTPFEQAGQMMSIRDMFDASKMRGMQREQLQNTLDEYRTYQSAAKDAGTPGSPNYFERLRDTLLQRGAPKTASEVEQHRLKSETEAANLRKTQVETHGMQVKQLRDRLATASTDDDLAALRDEAVRLYGPNVVQSMPKSVTDPAWPAYQARNLMDADKLAERLNPKLAMTDEGNVIQPRNPYTGATAGAPIEKRATPGETLHDATLRRGQDKVDARQGTFSPQSGALLAALAERGVSIPAGFRSRQQMAATLDSLIARNPGKSPDDIAELLRSGQIGFGAEKKETQTAAAIAGRVGVAGEEITQFAPLVEEASRKIPRGRFVPINKLMQMADSSFSDPDLKQLKTYINSMMNAYDQLAARGGTDKDKRAEAHALLTSADSHEALMAGINAFKREVTAAQRAADIASRPRSERDAARNGAPAGGGAAPKQSASGGIKFLRWVE